MTASPGKSVDEGQIFSAQVRAARALLGWSQGDLSERSGVSRNVIARLELGISDARMSTVRTIRETLVKAGVDLVTEPSGKFGVLRREPPA